MISLKLVTHDFGSSSADSQFLLLPEKFDLGSLQGLASDLGEQLVAHGFEGGEDSSALIAVKDGGKLKRIFFVGVGKVDKNCFSETMDRYRNALGNVVGLIRKHKLSSAFLVLDHDACSDNQSEFITDALVCLGMASYKFESFKSSGSSASLTCNLEVSVVDNAALRKGEVLKEAVVIYEAINLIRNLSDLPPNIASPDYINNQAALVARKHNLVFNTFGEERAKELGMGGFVAVGSGSDHEIRFFEMKYTSPNPDAKTVVLIGKGVAFDSGGVSLKPAQHMSDMKYDMSGAATVIGIAQIIAQLQANVNVICMAPLVENMPSGGSYRQDDILTHMNGTTSEVKNTDAEGRLILADAICYAEKFYQPELIIDIATLTGACVAALGHFYAGMFSSDQDIADSLKKIGDRVGDYVWQLPCSDNYLKGIESKVADLSNCGSSSFGGGAITAAIFLKQFVSQAKWVHLDIAGTEMGFPIKSYLGDGATGTCVRLLSRFLKEYY